MSEQGSTFCKHPDHNSQPIRFLCLEDSCRQDRLICHFCVRDRHRKHSLANLEKYIDPLARLGMNSQTENREKYCQSFESAISSISQSWERISVLVGSQSKFMEETVIQQMDALSQTFSEHLVERAEATMASGQASEEEVEEYVKMIHFLGQRNMNDPEKLMMLLKTVEKNIQQTIDELYTKLSFIFTDFQRKISKYSFNSQNIEQEEPRLKGQHIIQQKERVMQSLKQMNKSLNESFIKDQSSFLTETHRELPSQDPALKLQTDDSSSSQMEIHIGLQSQDSVGEMKSQMRSKIKKVVVTCCKNPEAQLAKILSFVHLEELEIFWFELAKKEYIIKIINNLHNLRVLTLNCANEFDEECSRLLPKKLPKLRKIEYCWDFYNSLREYDENIYFRLSPYTNRGCPLKTSVTREMVVALKKIENVWLGDFMYFRPSNSEIPFRNIKEFTLGQTKGKYFRIPEKLAVQLKDMRELLSLSILHVKIDENKLYPILLNNPFIKIFVVEGCDDISDESLKILSKYCNLTHLSIRESRTVEGNPIWDMASLTTLILVDCPRVRPTEAASGISKMRYLNYLNLYGNKWVTDELVKGIPNSEHFHTINLGKTSISNRSLSFLATMKRLKVLCLDCCNKLSGAAIAKLCSSVQSLEKISVWGLNGQVQSGTICDEDVEVMARKLPLLSHLSIRYCRQLDGLVFLQFKALRFLEVDRENLSKEVQWELQCRGVKLLLDLEKIVVDEQGVL